MINKPERSTTSVKIPTNLYDDFRIASIRTKMNLQELTERAMFLYVTDQEFRMKIHATYNTHYTGSSTIDAIK